MEVNGWLDVPAALLRGKQLPSPPYWMNKRLYELRSRSERRGEEENNPLPYRESNPGRPTRSLVITLIYSGCNNLTYLRSTYRRIALLLYA